MTDSSTSGSDNWLNEQMLHWQEMLGNTELPQQWQQLFENFKDQQFPDLSEQQSQLINLVRSQSERFAHFAESLSTGAGEQPATEQLVDNFQTYMQQQCNEMLQQQRNLPEPLASLVKSSGLNSETLKKIPLREILEKLASSPEIGSSPFGAAALSPAQIREVSQALLDYQDALSDYLEHYDQIFNQTGEDLKQLLEQQEDKIDSVRELQNLWVDCYEKAYKKQVFTDSYQASHGRISNSLIRARKLAFTARDKKLKVFGFVTREELDSTIRQQHGMRKQIRSQQQEIEFLKTQLQALQEQITKPVRRNAGSTTK